MIRITPKAYIHPEMKFSSSKLPTLLLQMVIEWVDVKERGKLLAVNKKLHYEILQTGLLPKKLFKCGLAFRKLQQPDENGEWLTPFSEVQTRMGTWIRFGRDPFRERRQSDHDESNSIQLNFICPFLIQMTLGFKSFKILLEDYDPEWEALRDEISTKLSKILPKNRHLEELIFYCDYEMLNFVDSLHFDSIDKIQLFTNNSDEPSTYSIVSERFLKLLSEKPLNESKALYWDSFFPLESEKLARINPKVIRLWVDHNFGAMLEFLETVLTGVLPASHQSLIELGTQYWRMDEDEYGHHIPKFLESFSTTKGFRKFEIENREIDRILGECGEKIEWPRQTPTAQHFFIRTDLKQNEWLMALVQIQRSFHVKLVKDFKICYRET